MDARRTLRILSFCEGISYLLLMLVAMPLKYVWGEPLAVRVAGSVHGVGTVALCIAAGAVYREGVLPRRTLAIAMLLSLVPFGFVLAERMLRKAEEQLAS